MSKRTQEKRIGDESWQVTQFAATEGLAVMARLFKLIGPTLGKAIGGLKATGVPRIGDIQTGTAYLGGLRGLLDADISNFNMTAFGDAVMTLADRLDEREVVDLVKRMLADTRINGSEVLPQFDVLFMGDYLKLFSVLRFVAEVNFGNFFAGVNGVAGKAKTTTASEMQ